MKQRESRQSKADKVWHAKQAIIDRLEGKQVHTRETFGLWSRVEDGRIAAIDTDLHDYSVAALQSIESRASRVTPGAHPRRARGVVDVDDAFGQ